MMDWKQLKELIELVNEKGFTEFEVEHEGLRLRISNAVGPAASSRPEPHRAMSGAAPAGDESLVSGDVPKADSDAQSPSLPPVGQLSAPPARPAGAPSLHLIKSPIVGTFYRSPSPDSPPFVKAGDRVTPDMVVCIIEAMKLMNEIQAEIAGEIVEIYAENTQAVEYDQPLFGVKVS